MAGEPQPRRLLGRAMRLKRTREFTRLRREGRRMACGCFIANWQVLPQANGSRVGVITSRRLGNAVKRARARRLLREVFRLHQHDLARPVELVLVAQGSIVGKGMQTVESAFMKLLRDANLLRSE